MRFFHTVRYAGTVTTHGDSKINEKLLHKYLGYLENSIYLSSYAKIESMTINENIQFLRRRFPFFFWWRKQ